MVLLLSGDGANGSTTFTDESPALRGNASVNGNTAVSTAVKKYGSGSIAFDGTGDNAAYADSNDWAFSTVPFTIEAWVRFNAAGIGTATQCIVSQWRTNLDRSWQLTYLSSNDLQFLVSDAGLSGTTVLSAPWTPVADTFYHIVAERSGNVWRIYVDGVMLDKHTETIGLHNSDAGLRIGNVFSSSETNYLNGYIDELRITKGVARYASDSGYVVPTAAFPRS